MKLTIYSNRKTNLKYNPQPHECVSYQLGFPTNSTNNLSFQNVKYFRKCEIFGRTWDFMEKESAVQFLVGGQKL